MDVNELISALKILKDQGFGTQKVYIKNSIATKEAEQVITRYSPTSNAIQIELK